MLWGVVFFNGRNSINQIGKSSYSRINPDNWFYSSRREGNISISNVSDTTSVPVDTSTVTVVSSAVANQEGKTSINELMVVSFNTRGGSENTEVTGSKLITELFLSK